MNKRFSQATLQLEDAETMVCTGEMLWVLGDAKVILLIVVAFFLGQQQEKTRSSRVAGLRGKMNQIPTLQGCTRQWDKAAV